MILKRYKNASSILKILANSIIRPLFIFVLLVNSTSSAIASPYIQENDSEEHARALLEKMRPEERIGQLFLISFEGNQADPESRIYDLIADYHIGGVVLEREQNNFVGPPSTIDVAQILIRGLQEAEGISSRIQQTDPITGEQYFPIYVPILVGISQDGDGYPYDQILDGLSPQPNPMTLGATWDPALAKSAGELLGSELSSLGINLLIGPSLDILDDPNPQNSGSIGVQSFGGDPYWVSLMAQSYIEGIHLGSGNLVAVVVKHLPGFGSSDRPLDEEIPTIRKSLAELTQLELAPFFAVTGDAPNKISQTDAMLLSHIRYQGFQGNIRATTRPVSFDPQAFSELMALEAFATWRDSGGVIISDSLGTRAVRRHLDPSEQIFNGPAVALDAFLAGNDLLYLGNFSADGQSDSFSAVIDTLQFFTQKYREDVAFAERVDEAVVRILALKFNLYPSFSTTAIYPSLTMPDSFGQNDDLLFNIMLEAATLLSPSADQLAEIIPESPRIEERIVFIIDSYSISQCDDCESFSLVNPVGFEAAVERLYGPDAGNQIAPGNVSSFSFRELTVGLDTTIGGDNLLMSNLDSADWIVFGILDEDDFREDSGALQRLISERPELIQDKKLIVFSLNAPYFLDATEISKLSAYYGLYGKDKIVADVAARLLFQEIAAPGASPISIDGIAYNLIEATSPDPQRQFDLSISLVELGTGNALAAPTVIGDINDLITPIFQAGDHIEVVAGPILDRNGNPVPDQTPVQFSFLISNEDSSINRTIDTVTRSSLATVNYSIESEGSLQISAQAGDPSALSDQLLFAVVGINAEGLALQANQLAATGEFEPSADIGDENSDESAIIPLPRLELADWFLAVLVAAFMALLAYQLGSTVTNVRWGVRWAFSALIGGLISTSYLALNMPGSETVFEGWGAWGIATMTLIFSGTGWLIAWTWQKYKNKSNSNH